MNRVDWGFTTPERRKHGLGPVGLGIYGEGEARRFVDDHPDCTVVRRTVDVGDWEEA